MDVNLSIENEVVAGTNNGGEDLHLILSCQIYGIDGDGHNLIAAVMAGMPDEIRKVFREKDVENEEMGWTTLEEAREGNEDGSIVFFQGTVYYPVTPHYEITHEESYEAFNKRLMDNFVDWTAWEHRRGLGQAVYNWTFERTVYIDGNAD